MIEVTQIIHWRLMTHVWALQINLIAAISSDILARADIVMTAS